MPGGFAFTPPSGHMTTCGSFVTSGAACSTGLPASPEEIDAVNATLRRVEAQLLARPRGEA